MPKQVFLACFELLVARFGPPKIPKRLENGLFWDQKITQKLGKKCVFSKMIVDHLGGLNKWNEPIASHFGPSKVTKCLENGLFCDQKWVKNVFF